MKTSIHDTATMEITLHFAIPYGTMSYHNMKNKIPSGILAFLHQLHAICFYYTGSRVVLLPFGDGGIAADGYWRKHVPMEHLLLQSCHNREFDEPADDVVNLQHP